MADLIDSVTISLDGNDRDLFPFFPYLLKDLWELGSSSEVLLNLLQENHIHENLDEFNILDLGCGKGAVAIPVIKEHGGTLLGIDAVPEFIEEAKVKSEEFGIADSCRFFVSDIRKEVDKLTGFNLIMLSSIGPVFGNVKETLYKVERCLEQGGYIFLDDGFIPEGSEISLQNVQHEKEFYAQIDHSNFDIIDSYIFNKKEMTEANNKIYSSIKRRTDELIIKYPGHTKIFEAYLSDQRAENEILENKITCAAFLLRKISG